MSKPTHNDDKSSSSAARSIRIEGTSDEFILIPQQVDPESSEVPTDTFDLGSLISILQRRLPLVLGIVLAAVGVGAAVTLGQRFFIPVFEGSFSLLVGDPVSSNEESPSPESGTDLKGLALQSSRVPNIQISQDLIDVLSSPFLLKPISKQLGINEDELSKNLTIERRSGDSSSVLDISLQWKDPKKGEKILNTLMNSYLRFSTNQRSEKLAEGISYLNEQAPALQNKLSVIQGELSDFRIRNRFLEPSKEGDAIVKQLESLKERQDELLRKQAELKALTAAIRAGNVSGQQIPEIGQRLSTAPSTNGAVGARAGTGLDQLQIDLSELEKELAIANATFQSSTPLVQSLKARIIRVKALLQQRQLDAIDVTLRQIYGEQEEIRRQQSDLERKFTQNPTLIRQHDAIQQRLEVAKANLTAFIKAREDIRLLVAQRTVPWKVISQPRFDSTLVSPSIPKNLVLSLVLGLGLGGAAAYLKDMAENQYHSPKEVAKSLKLPILGTIPFLPVPFTYEKLQDRTIDQNDVDEELIESLENLYTDIKWLRENKELRMIAITSTIEGEGRSTIAAYLSKTIRDLGKKVLLVDANIQKPRLDSWFRLSNLKGFTSLLSEPSNHPKDFIQTVDHGLDILTAGPTPQNSTSLLISERCQTLLAEIRKLDGYDLILFDLPPALKLSDPLLISQYVDGILFVVSLENVHKDLPSQALTRLKTTGVDLLGLVCNELETSTGTPMEVIRQIREGVPAVFSGSNRLGEARVTPLGM